MPALIEKIGLLKKDAFSEDKKFYYRVENVIYDHRNSEVAVSFIVINKDTGEQHKVVEGIFLQPKKDAVVHEVDLSGMTQQQAQQAINELMVKYQDLKPPPKKRGRPPKKKEESV